MNLGQNMGRLSLQARKLRNGQDIVRLAPSLFPRIIHQHGIALIPAAAIRKFRMGRSNLGLAPDDGQPLVHLHAGVIVGLGKAKLVACPDDNTLLALLGSEQLRDHVVHVLGTRR